MACVDVHQHLWPEELIRALERRQEPPRLRAAQLELRIEGSFEVDLLDHDPARRLGLMDADGVDVAVLSAVPAHLAADPALAEAWHAGARRLVDESGGRFLALAAGQPLGGFAGVCLAAGELVAGADATLAALATTGGFLFVHPGTPEQPAREVPGWWVALTDYTAQMQAAYLAWLTRDAARFPSVRVVFALLAGGGPFQLERLRSRGVAVGAPDELAAYFDVSSYGPAAIGMLAGAGLGGRLLYGSDVPVLEARVTLDAVRACPPDLAHSLLHENATALLEGASDRSPEATERRERSR